MTITAVQVLPGPGIVGRFGDVLLWAEAGDGDGATVIARLVGLARSVADGANRQPLGAQVTEVLRADRRAVSALVLVAPSGGGLQAIVHGWGRVLADGVDIDGGWADRELAWTNPIAAGRGGDVLRAPSAGSVLDLRRGTSPGGGAAMVLAAGGAASSRVPQRTSSPPPAAAAPEFHLVDFDAEPPRREPLPLGGGGGVATGPAQVTVKGVACGRGHLNDPVALVCRTCRVAMDQVTRILQDGPRPTLGALVLDDGTTFGLDTDHVVGSAPDDHDARGAGRPVLVADPTGQVAPVHAEVRLVGWDVVLVARAPTFVLAPGTRQWTPAPPGQPTPLPLGTRVAVGQRTFVIA